MARDCKVRFSVSTGLQSVNVPETPPSATPSRSGLAAARSPLQQAVLRGDPDEVRLFLNSSSAPAVNAKDIAGRTALMLAVEADSPDTIDLLLRHGAEPNEGNAFGTSALFQAVCARRHRCAERLLLGGALVNAHSLRQRHAPLHAACAVGDARMVSLLLSFGAETDALDYQHRVPLHDAAGGGFADCVTLLLRSGASVDIRDLGGRTPLGVAHDAVCRGVLLKADATLSPADLKQLLRERPAALQQLLDGGIQQDERGKLLVSYKPLRDVGGAGHPFEAELLTELQRSGRWELLAHPAVELLLELTRQDSYFVFHTAAKILWCLIFLASLLGTMAVDLYRVGGEVTKLKRVMIGGLMTLNSIQMLFLLVKLCIIGKGFFSSGRRWPVLVKTVLIFVVVFLHGELEKRIVYSLAVLMAFFEFTTALESIAVWKTTRAISSLLHVTRSIVEYLIVYLPVLIGFAIAFFVMFNSKDPSGNSLFHSNFLVINMAAMVLGEVDVMEAEMHAPRSGLGYALSTVLVVMFVVLVPIVMLNLLLALTISDTTKFLSKGGAEFLRNLANRTAWNQQAAFMIADWIGMLKHLLPRCLFDPLARYSLQFKWHSVLPRPAASERDTPHITVDPFAQGGKKVRATVKGSTRLFRVRNGLRQSLDAIVQSRRAANAAVDGALPAIQLDLQPDDRFSSCATAGSRSSCGSCERLGHSVNAILLDPTLGGRGAGSAELCPASAAAGRSCSSSWLRSSQLSASSGATLGQQSPLHDRLERLEERLDQRLKAIEDMLKRMAASSAK